MPAKPGIGPAVLTLSVHSQSVQSFSHVQLFVTPWTTAHQASLSITNFWSLLKLMVGFPLGVIGERNGKPLQDSCLENPMNSMKRN